MQEWDLSIQSETRKTQVQGHGLDTGVSVLINQTSKMRHTTRVFPDNKQGHGGLAVDSCRTHSCFAGEERKELTVQHTMLRGQDAPPAQLLSLPRMSPWKVLSASVGSLYLYHSDAQLIRVLVSTFKTSPLCLFLWSNNRILDCYIYGTIIQSSCLILHLNNSKKKKIPGQTSSSMTSSYYHNQKLNPISKFLVSALFSAKHLLFLENFPVLITFHLVPC